MKSDYEKMVSCLCLTRNRVAFLQNAVLQFLEQTYPSKELLVIYDSDDTETISYIHTLSDARIRPIEAPAHPRLLLGEKRNLAIECADGEYIAVWDDDDWNSPIRLEDQMNAILRTKRHACVLLRIALYDSTTDTFYLSNVRGWENTLLCKRSSMVPYAALNQGEDTPVVEALMSSRKLVLLDHPDLYVYIYHGNNTWQHYHWNKRILPNACIDDDVVDNAMKYNVRNKAIPPLTT